MDVRSPEVRYTFRDDGLLGIRLSRDVPPWILEVRDGTLAARKAPKVPVGGVVTAINGYDLSEKENPRALRGCLVEVDIKQGGGMYSAVISYI